MTEYHKIQTVYMRDPATKHRTLLDGQWSMPEFGYLASLPWELTEKVDGTNIRIVSGPGSVVFGGRTDAAQIPAKLVERLQKRFLGNAALESIGDCVLYGEGYGAGIPGRVTSLCGCRHTGVSHDSRGDVHPGIRPA